MPIEVIELGHDGTLTTTTDPGDVPASPAEVPQAGTGTTAETAPASTPGAQGESAPPSQDAPPPDGEALAVSAPEGEDDADVPDETATIPFVNRRIKQLNAKRRDTEKQLADERQQNALRTAQLEARLDTLTRVISGAAPDVPASPPQPTGPPQAEQFADNESYDRAAARYEAEQLMRERDQQMQQIRFHQELMSREQRFEAEHPDFHAVVRGGLAGKVGPVLQQALMLVPDGPAVAYALARQPELVQRLNQMPPPLVLMELGRLSPQAPSAVSPAMGSTNGNGTAPPPATPLPEPMAPVGGGGSMAAPTFNENMSQREYEQYRARTSQIPYVRRS